MTKLPFFIFKKIFQKNRAFGRPSFPQGRARNDLPAGLPPVCLPCFLLPCSSLACRPACLPACRPACLLACLPACVLGDCLSACLCACLPACLRARLLSCWAVVVLELVGSWVSPSRWVLLRVLVLARYRRSFVLALRALFPHRCAASHERRGTDRPSSCHAERLL